MNNRCYLEIKRENRISYQEAIGSKVSFELRDDDDDGDGERRLQSTSLAILRPKAKDPPQDTTRGRTHG